MGTQTATPSFARFTRPGFGFTPRSRTESKNKSGNNANGDDDWYIPYNGPYEPPPKEPAPRRQKARDSWGDPVDGIENEEENTGLEDRELHLRYGGHRGRGGADFRGGGEAEEYGKTRGRSRDRTFSVISGQTTSSGAVDPSRASMGTTPRRRSTISTGSPPPMPLSFVSLDAVRAGGVGESPVPPHAARRRRHSKETNPNRISMASIFSFGGGGASNRKSAQVSPSGQQATLGRLNTKGYGKLESPAHSGGSSSDHSEPKKPRQLHDQIMVQADKLTSTVTDDEEYYNSYYSTLLNPRNPNNKLDAERTQLSPTTSTSVGSSISHGGSSRKNSTSTSSGHPYAYVFPQKLTPIPSAVDVPHSAPLIPTPYTSNNPPKLTFTTSQVHGPSSADPGRTAFSPRLGVSNSGKLKVSISTPNLRDTVIVTGRNDTTMNNDNGSNTQAGPTFVFPKGKDRWLSAETWCDALLFPRPRLKLKQQSPVEGGPHVIHQVEASMTMTSGRIVSPPTTPLNEEEFGIMQRGGWQRREAGVESRVLAHSRSLVDLRNKPPRKVKKEKEKYEGSFASHKEVIAAGEAAKAGKAPRPTSWAKDDLALLTPVPSLDHVLREAEQLELDRRAWKQQATNSFGNKQARSLSRTRSKSLTQKGRRKMDVGASVRGHHHQSSMEYIAARACLGSQGVVMTPTIAAPKLNTSFSDGNTSTGTHSHSNSLAKTLTKSSKSHSHTHSRNDSWSTNAIKLAKATVICGFPNSSGGANTIPDTSSSIIGTGPYRGPPDLEGALKRDSTKVIRLADPAHLPIDRGGPLPPVGGALATSLGHANYTYTRKTPSPSGSHSISESKVGVAIGTPPSEENANPDGDYANYVPSHPYAQGGLSFSTGGTAGGAGEAHQPSQHGQHGEFAGAHLSLVHPASAKVPPISEIIARHKLSPHMAALHMPHPYAQARAQAGAPRDSYIDANGLVGQHRSEDGTPHTTKMWAQLSPGVVREILPGDLQYSPYLEEGGGVGHSGSEGKEKRSSGNGAEVRDDDNDDGDAKDRRTLNIRDTVGVGETLVRAGEVRDDLLPEFGGVRSGRRNGVHLFPSSGSVDLGKPHQQPLEKLDMSQIIEYHTPTARPTLEENSRLQSNSFDGTSSSSPHSPLILGSPHDLDTFKDLFYRPTRSVQRTQNEPALPETPSPPQHLSNLAGGSNISWDIHRRTGSSSLTNLARQLSDEFEQMAMERERERTSSQYSNGNGSFLYEDQRILPSGIPSRQQSRGSSISGGTGAGLVRRPTAEGGSLEFVFEEVIPMSSSPTSDHEGLGLGLGMADPIHAFEPSDTLPEDVQSSRASSFIESSEGDDPTEMYRVGMVESVSTPPAVSSMHRNSFLGTVFVHDNNANATTLAHANENWNQNPNENQNHHEQEHQRRPRLRHEGVESPESRSARILSGLQPPSTDATRSSFMTTSTASRMSGLSDFPAPPKSHHHPHHHPGNVGNSEDDTVVMPPMQRQEEPQNNHLATPGRMSLLSSYFNEAMAESESRSQSRTDDVQQDSPTLMQAALEEEDRVAFSQHQEHGR